MRSLMTLALTSLLIGCLAGTAHAWRHSGSSISVPEEIKRVLRQAASDPGVKELMTKGVALEIATVKNPFGHSTRARLKLEDGVARVQIGRHDVLDIDLSSGKSSACSNVNLGYYAKPVAKVFAVIGISSMEKKLASLTQRKLQGLRTDEALTNEVREGYARALRHDAVRKAISSGLRLDAAALPDGDEPLRIKVHGNRIWAQPGSNTWGPPGVPHMTTARSGLAGLVLNLKGSGGSLTRSGHLPMRTLGFAPGSLTASAVERNLIASANKALAETSR